MKGFTMMLVGMVVLGVALGGAFLGGMAVGGGDEAEAAAPTASLQAPRLGGQGAATAGGSSRQQLRSRIQSGDLSPEDLAQLRQQFGGQFGSTGGTEGQTGGGAEGFATGGRLRGTIESIDGNVLTLNTAQGTLHVTISPDTTIQVTTEAAVTDLSNGMTLTVMGERAEDGTFAAATIFSLPEGDQGFGWFGGGGFGGRGGGGFGGGQ